MNSRLFKTTWLHFRSVVRTPAFQALLIQSLSFFLALLIQAGLSIFTVLQLTNALFALLQGIMAAAITYQRSLAPWWMLIQFFFPIALVTMLAIQLPPSLFLVAFLFLLGFYWNTFRTQVPFYPSHPAVSLLVSRIVPQDRPFSFIDIGSGLGGLVMDLAETRSDSIFTGIEIAPLPWLASFLRGRMRRSHARFYRGDYNDLHFASYDVIFAHLSPAAMPSLWNKAKNEMRPGTLLLSYRFIVPGTTPEVIKINSGKAALYIWHM